MSFDAKKRQVLSSPPFVEGRDASPKGSLDRPILECIHFINSLRDFVTTSSCSGRISLYRQPDSKGVDWLLVEHGTVSSSDLISAVQRLPVSEDLVVLKCEAFILHLLCRDQSSAGLMLGVARSCGFRESGVVLAQQTSLAIRTTAFGLEMPIAVGSRLLLDQEGVDIAVREANRRIAANFERADRFLHSLKETFGWPRFRLIKAPCPLLRRWGHSSFAIGDEVVTVGGYGCEDTSSGGGSRRLSSLWWRPPGEASLRKQGVEVVHGVAVFSTSMQLIVCSGGRLSPLLALPCLRLFNTDLDALTPLETGDVPLPRWGHSFTPMGANIFLLYGGRDGKRIFGDGFTLTYIAERQIWEWKKLPVLPMRGRFFHAACAVFDSPDVLIHGGVCDIEDCIGDFRFFRLSSDGRCNEISIELGPFIPRFGHSLTYIGAKTYIMTGGSSFEDTFPASEESKLDNFGEGFIVNLSADAVQGYSLTVRELRLDGESGASIPFQLGRIHHQTVYSFERRVLYLVGGGMHCLAFGPVYSDIFALSVGMNSQSTQEPVLERFSQLREFSPQSEEMAGVVILVQPAKVRSLKVFLERHKWLDKTKRISKMAQEESNHSITTINLELKSVSLSELPCDHSDLMAVPITEEFATKLNNFLLPIDILSYFTELLGAQCVHIHEQQVKLSKRSQVDGNRKAHEVQQHHSPST